MLERGATLSSEIRQQGQLIEEMVGGVGQILEMTGQTNQIAERALETSTTLSRETVMALITWSSMLSVGVTEIDDQHKKLIDLVNQLNDAMHAGKGKDALQPVLNELVRYTQYPFGTEERLMARHHHEASADHKREHQKFVATVSAF